MIELEDTTKYAFFTIRRFRVTDISIAEKHCAVVTQYHFHRWRLDENEEDLVGGFDYLAFIDFYLHVKMATQLEDGPILVHCEDGKLSGYTAVLITA